MVFYKQHEFIHFYRQLIETFRRIGKWPLLEEDWDNSTFNITDMLTSVAQNFGDPILFKVFIDAESKNTTIHSLYVSVI